MTLRIHRHAETGRYALRSQGEIVALYPTRDAAIAGADRYARTGDPIPVVAGTIHAIPHTGGWVRYLLESSDEDREIVILPA